MMTAFLEKCMHHRREGLGGKGVVKDVVYCAGADRGVVLEIALGSRYLGIGYHNDKNIQ